MPPPAKRGCRETLSKGQLAQLKAAQYSRGSAENVGVHWHDFEIPLPDQQIRCVLVVAREKKDVSSSSSSSSDNDSNSINALNSSSSNSRSNISSSSCSSTSSCNSYKK